MQTLIVIFLLTSLFSCSDRQTKNLNVQKNDFTESANTFIISAIEVKFPLRLDETNLEDKNKKIHLNEGIISKIDETVKEYASDFDFYNTSQTYKDCYINTIRLHDSLQTIYLVLLNHYPTGLINSKVLFYDNQKKEFTNKTFDFNLHALYHFDNGKLKPTNLKTGFKITSPEIELVDFNKDGVNDYKFTRLFRNGSFNSIHATILTIKNLTIDTLYFNEKGLYEWAEK